VGVEGLSGLSGLNAPGGFDAAGSAALGRALIGVLLYGFIFQLFWALRRDLRSAGAGPQAMLTLIEAPEEVRAAGLLPGQAFVVGSPATLGRAPGNTVALPAETVSLSHLRLVYRNGGWWVEDLGSTNGTAVNGEPVAAITRLASGDEIGCGPHVRLRLYES
jgi:hypothetical protein